MHLPQHLDVLPVGEAELFDAWRVDIREPSKWQAVLSDFWKQYVLYDKCHIMNMAGSPPRTRTVPLYLHGDEGRGKYKLPVMVQAVQPCLSWKGSKYKNSSGPHELSHKFSMN